MTNTITAQELKMLAFCNSPEQTYNIDGRSCRWVGIGWIDEGPAGNYDIKVIRL